MTDEHEKERERCRSIKDNNNEAQSEASARCGTVAPGYNEDDVHKLRLCRQTLSNLANASSQGVDCGQQLKSHSHLINCYAAATSCSCSCSCSNANDAPDMPDAYTYLIPDICICKYLPPLRVQRHSETPCGLVALPLQLQHLVQPLR